MGKEEPKKKRKRGRPRGSGQFEGQVINIRLHFGDLVRVERLAQHLDQTQSALIREAVHKYLAEEEERLGIGPEDS